MYLIRMFPFFFCEKEFSANAKIPPLLALSLHRRPRDVVSLAPTARAVDRSSWQPSDESTVAQGGWTAGWRAWTDRGEVSARADAEPDVYVRITFDARSFPSLSHLSLFLPVFPLSFSPSCSSDRVAIHPALGPTCSWCLWSSCSQPIARLPEGRPWSVADSDTMEWFDRHRRR